MFASGYKQLISFCPYTGVMHVCAFRVSVKKIKSMGNLGGIRTHCSDVCTSKQEGVCSYPARVACGFFSQMLGQCIIYINLVFKLDVSFVYCATIVLHDSVTEFI